MGSLLIGNAQGSVERILFIDWFVALELLALGSVTWDGMDMYMNLRLQPAFGEALLRAHRFG